MKLTLYDKSINFVDSFKYLGCILSKNFTDYCDIDRFYKSFNRSSGFLLRKFNSTDTNILFSLFNSYCSSFYGCELWTAKNKCKSILKEFGVSYHAVLKEKKFKVVQTF